jgi:ABC-type nitrate/sulfonate/bicarbonate transport system ATPase subunit
MRAGAAARPTEEGKALVDVRGVDKRFGDTLAVSDASLRVARGDFLTIVGPSGCGKTTLLRMIAGFDRPDAGEIELHGARVEAVPPHKRSIGMVFQKLALFPHMTAAQNVAYPLKMRRFDPSDIPGRVTRYLDLVQLGGYGARRPHELSGGQQQRVAIARALSFGPDLLLLDEPLSALDKKLREEMQLEFRRIQQELGVTTINVTHDQREALVMSDRIVVMQGGRVAAGRDARGSLPRAPQPLRRGLSWDDLHGPRRGRVRRAGRAADPRRRHAPARAARPFARAGRGGGLRDPRRAHPHPRRGGGGRLRRGSRGRRRAADLRGRPRRL